MDSKDSEVEGLPPDGFTGFIGGGAAARGIHRIHRWRGCRQRDSQDSEVKGLPPEGST